MGRKAIFSISLTVLILSTLFSSRLFSEQATVRTIERGDTVSFLSIKIYGFYNEEIAMLIKEANPGIKDLNRITVGQRLVFPVYNPNDKNKPYCIKTSASCAVITYLSGKATLKKKFKDEWKYLNPNDLLMPGDVIRTGNDGIVELVVNNTDVMRLSSNTELTIEEAKLVNEQPEAKVKFSVGKVWAKIKSYVERSGKFELGFPTAVAAVQGTVYQAELAADSSATVKVYNGEVKVAGKGQDNGGANSPRRLGPPKQVSGPKQVSMMDWVRIVREMQKISFGPGQPPGEPEDFTDAPGEWEKFNRERDIKFESQ
ncbi:MAG: hypothetical protein GF307_11500 [candidate division Zixibacteria bacterium]|nr:hypothetical protein [candidate division Zixibacteria bacterium]